MSWRGTLLAVLAGLLAATFLLLSLRSRTRSPDQPLLSVDPSQVQALSVRDGLVETHLEKSGGVWWITTPLKDRADAALVSRLLSEATSIKPLDRLPSSDLRGSLSLESLDLRPPKRVLGLNDGKNHLLSFGAEGATPQLVYARVEDDPSVYAVSSETAALAFGPVERFRDPQPLSVNPDAVTGITITRRGTAGEIVLRKEGRNWKIVSPLNAPADPKLLSEWLTKVLSSKILRWMPADTDAATCGLDSPSFTLELRSEGEAPVRLELGNGTEGSGSPIPARSSGRPGIFLIGENASWSGVTPLTLRSRHVATVDPATVDQLVITRGDSTIDLSRKKGSDDWQIGDRIIPAASVTEWFRNLRDLSASSFEPATPERLAARGLSEPVATIRLISRLSENTAEENAGEVTLLNLQIGSAGPDGIALRLHDADDLMISSPENIEVLLSGPAGSSVGEPSPAPAPSATPSPTSSPLH